MVELRLSEHQNSIGSCVFLLWQRHFNIVPLIENCTAEEVRSAVLYGCGHGTKKIVLTLKLVKF